MSLLDGSISLLSETTITDLAPTYQAIDLSGGLPFWPFVLIGVTAILIAAGCWVIRWMRVPCLPLVDDLTLELCRANDIGLHHRTLLDQVARIAGVRHTAELFLSPVIFDEAVSVAESQKRFRNGQRNLLHEVRRLLFD